MTDVLTWQGKPIDPKLEVDLAADSMAKATTPEPFSTSKTSNWVAKAGGLPPYIQHVAHDLLDNPKFMKGATPQERESRAIGMAVGIIKNWAHGHDGKGSKVHPDTASAAKLALKEWEEKKAKAHADNLSQDLSLDGIEFDVAKYTLKLAEERREQGLDLAVFDSHKHPRLHGKFVRSLVTGEEVKAGDFSHLDKHYGQRPGAFPEKASESAKKHYDYAHGWAKTLEPDRQIGAGGIGDPHMIVRWKNGNYQVTDSSKPVEWNQGGRLISHEDHARQQAVSSEYTTAAQAAHHAAELLIQHRNEHPAAAAYVPKKGDSVRVYNAGEDRSSVAGKLVHTVDAVHNDGMVTVKMPDAPSLGGGQKRKVHHSHIVPVA